MEGTYDHFFEANKALWDARTGPHVQSDFYRLEDFRQGWNPLNSVELEEVGDVSGKSLLHLQCHFGMDTLAWQRLGAHCTGVDFSGEAIGKAQQLAAELGLPARFICCNVYDLPQHDQHTYDIVFTSYGTIGWLPDLDRWAAVIARALKPGGHFYIADFHPVVWMFDNDFRQIVYTYHQSAVIEETEEGTYADREATIKRKSYGWNHSLGETVNALTRHGLQIMHLNEFPFSPYNCFRNTVQGDDGYYRIRGLEGLIPMMYSIKAVKA